jgi:hypothetical protein
LCLNCCCHRQSHPPPPHNYTGCSIQTLSPPPPFHHTHPMHNGPYSLGPPSQNRQHLMSISVTRSSLSSSSTAAKSSSSCCQAGPNPCPPAKTVVLPVTLPRDES